MVETSETSFENLKEGINWNFLADNITETLPNDWRLIDKELSAKAALDPKYMTFKKWLLDNGAIFDECVEFPCIMQNGVMGLGAKKEIKRNQAFLFIPNSCIVSLTRVRESAEMKTIIEENPSIFGKKHPDNE